MSKSHSITRFALGLFLLGLAAPTYARADSEEQWSNPWYCALLYPDGISPDCYGDDYQWRCYDELTTCGFYPNGANGSMTDNQHNCTDTEPTWRNLSHVEFR